MRNWGGFWAGLMRVPNRDLGRVRQGSWVAACTPNTDPGATLVMAVGWVWIHILCWRIEDAWMYVVWYIRNGLCLDWLLYHTCDLITYMWYISLPVSGAKQAHSIATAHKARVELARAEKIPTPFSSRYLEVNLGISSELPSNAISIWRNCHLWVGPGSR